MNARRIHLLPFAACALACALARPAAAQPSAQPTAETIVKTPAELQAALEKGGRIALLPGTTYNGAFKIAVPGTVIFAHGASIVGPKAGAPAVYVTASNVEISDLTLTSADPQGVFRCGDNDRRQKTLEQVPHGLQLRNVHIPSYRGRWGFVINCADVDLDGIGCDDLWDPGGNDSQCLAIENTPGNIHVIRFHATAGSEPILIGGARMAIPGLVPKHIVFEQGAISRPLSWRTDGVKRTVKNLFEMKTGSDVTVRHVTMDGCWKDGQACYAIVVTPRLGGDIHRVTFDHVLIDHVNACYEFLGADDHGTPTPAPLSEITVSNSTCRASTEYGGLGILALITGGPHDVSFIDNTAILDGTRLIVVDSSGHILHADGTSGPPPPIAKLVVTGNRFVATRYSFMLGKGSGANATGDYSASVANITVTGNTFAGAAAALKKAFPENRYVDRAAFDALIGGD
jgi:hypothetical protein